MSNVSTKHKLWSSEVRSLAIMSGKGGTGKSIIAASLGYVLAHCGFRTLLIDADFFTGGLSFYMLAASPRRVEIGLQDIFFGHSDPAALQPIIIPDTFCEKNLFLLPAITRRHGLGPEFRLGREYSSLEPLANQLSGVVQRALDQDGFDYILVDTRGGSDFTSIACALATGAFVVVTEADKTSWDVGAILLDSLDQSAAKSGYDVLRLGFIINKNVLPSEAIEAFLKRAWDCAHLSTVPLDENAIRYFQEDRVPIAADPACPFSVALLPVVRKLFVSEAWDEVQTGGLRRLEREAEEASRLKHESEQRLKRAETFALLARVYGTLIATLLLAYLGYSVLRARRLDTSFDLAVVVVTAVLIFVMTTADPRFLERLISTLLGRRGERNR